MGTVLMTNRNTTVQMEKTEDILDSAIEKDETCDLSSSPNRCAALTKISAGQDEGDSTVQEPEKSEEGTALTSSVEEQVDPMSEHLASKPEKNMPLLFNDECDEQASAEKVASEEDSSLPLFHQPTDAEPEPCDSKAEINVPHIGQEENEPTDSIEKEGNVEPNSFILGEENDMPLQKVDQEQTDTTLVDSDPPHQPLSKEDDAVTEPTVFEESHNSADIPVKPSISSEENISSQSVCQENVDLLLTGTSSEEQDVTLNEPSALLSTEQSILPSSVPIQQDPEQPLESSAPKTGENVPFQISDLESSEATSGLTKAEALAPSTVVEETVVEEENKELETITEDVCDEPPTKKRLVEMTHEEEMETSAIENSPIVPLKKLESHRMQTREANSLKARKKHDEEETRASGVSDVCPPVVLATMNGRPSGASSVNEEMGVSRKSDTIISSVKKTRAKDSSKSQSTLGRRCDYRHKKRAPIRFRGIDWKYLTLLGKAGMKKQNSPKRSTKEGVMVAAYEETFLEPTSSV